MDNTRQVLAELCADLRSLRIQAGGPSLRTLAERVRIGKSQLGAILNGQVREPPDWRVVAGIVEVCTRHAREHGRIERLALPAGIEEFWRPRHAMVEHAFAQQKRRPEPAPAKPAGQPAADQPAAGRAPANQTAGDQPHVRVPPRQLPAAVRHLVGQTPPLARLTALLDEAGTTPATAVVAAVVGPAGTGKSSLAIRWAHQVAEKYPDGQLHLNLRGFDPSGSPMSPAEALRTLLDAFAVPPEGIPRSLDAQAGLYRSLLAGRRVLIVLDNARDAEQVRPLLPSSSGCLAVITSRDSLTGLVATNNVERVVLGLLSPEDALEMLAQRLGDDRWVAEAPAVQEIIQRCSGLPLALAVTAARATMQRDRPLAAIAEELRQAGESLDPFASGDPLADVRTAFSWSYDTLSPAAARLFRLLALAPGPGIGTAAAASLAGLPRREVRSAMTELVQSQLVMEVAPGRYSFHDLLRTYAIEQAHAGEPAESREAAVRRVLDHYLHTGDAADRKLYAARGRIALPPAAAGVVPETITDLEQAIVWFAREHLALPAAIELSLRYHLHGYAWRLTWVTNTFFSRQGHWHECLRLQRLALDAARHLGDALAEAECHRMVGRTLVRLGRFDEARHSLVEAVRMWVDLGDTVGQAHDQLNLGEVCMRLGRLDDALRHAQQALELYRAAGHESGQANALNNCGYLHAQLGDHEQALRQCEQALRLHQRIGDEQGEATTWDSLGYTHHLREEHEDAVGCYERAVALYAGHGHRYFEALSLIGLGDSCEAMGRPATAAEVWRRALEVLTELESPDRADVQTRLARLDGHDTGPATA
jgi:tetratricopeptide (TPR) repeat protein